MEEFKKHGKVGRAALRADMDRKTARKYLAADKLPSELKEPRTWRTRADPFEDDWPYVLEMLEDAPDLEAVALFEHLVECQPGKYQEGQVRTFPLCQDSCRPKGDSFLRLLPRRGRPPMGGRISKS